LKRKDAKIASGRGKRGVIRAKSYPAPIAPAHLGVALTSHWPIVGLALVTLLLKSLIYAPLSIWPVAFVCLVPWVIAIGTASEARRVYVYSYLLGVAFFLLNLRWLYVAAGPWYVPMAAYLGIYFPLMACPLRHVVRRRRLPLGVVLPVIWTGCEMLRAVAFSGFPWFFLSHSLYEVLTLVQICDLVGAYGVSFLVTAVNGAIADVVLAVIAARSASKPAPNRRQARVSVVFALVLLAATCVYGRIQLLADTSRPGPRIAVIQGDYPDSITGPATGGYKKSQQYLAMMAKAAQQEVELYLLPESAWPMFLNAEFRHSDPSIVRRSKWLNTLFGGSDPKVDPERSFRRHQKISTDSFQKLQAFATGNKAYIVVGAGSLFPSLYDLLADVRNYNSAFVFSPQGGEPERYDKRHLVYFGEVIPFRFGRLRPLYFSLNAITPFSGPNNWEFSLFPGEAFRILSMRAASQQGQAYRFATPICYEDVMPYVSRRFTAGDGDGKEGKRVDFLLNISNDGWFGRGGQQAQHLAICVMRAVENRVGVARSVNTGISGFIDPTGRLHDLVGADRSPDLGYGFGYAVSNIVVDSRFSVYSRYGDWFAWACTCLWLVFYCDYFLVRALARRAEEKMESR